MRTIIVGAGAAGCVLAARLSERDDQDVVLVEAGPDYAPEDLPEKLANGRHNGLFGHDWGLKHKPNSQQRLKFAFPRGRVVGGSTAVNTCIAIRGQPQDFREWEDRGLPEWSWEHCLAAFNKMERDLDYGSEPYHGDSGPLPIRRHRPKEWTRWQAAFMESCAATGYPEMEDSNRPEAHGFGAHAMNKIDGRRISAAEAWLTREVRERDNFTLLPDTRVVRAVFRAKRAIGVDVIDAEGGRFLPADRVVFSGGAIHTPILLNRSGVGRKDDLSRLGVDVVAHNEAVNARLLDHPGCAIFFWPKRGVVSVKDPLIQTVCRYTSKQSTVPGDIQLQAGSKFAAPGLNSRGCSIMAAIGKPKGTGSLRIKSLKLSARPRIESALLDHPDDRAMAVEAMKRAFEIAQHPAMQQLAKHFWPRKRRLTREDWIDAWIRNSTDSGYHPSGTVPMGDESDPEAATDALGRVYGVEGLHVVDASLMPTIPSANTNLATLMIGERMAELLLA